MYSLPRDGFRAQKLFDDVCSANDVNACWTAGEAFDGPGDPRARPIAQEFYRRAVALTEPRCARGEALGCERLGKAYFSGAGVPESAAMGEAYFDRAKRASR